MARMRYIPCEGRSSSAQRLPRDSIDLHPQPLFLREEADVSRLSVGVPWCRMVIYAYARMRPARPGPRERCCQCFRGREASKGM